MTPHIFFIPTFPFHSEYIAKKLRRIFFYAILFMTRDNLKAVSQSTGKVVRP